MDIEDHLARQAGVISRRQALSLGLNDNNIKRLLRRREWALVLPGVYLNHTGSPSALQREWAAVLRHRRAALAGTTALQRSGITTGSDRDKRSDPREIEIVVPHAETPAAAPGIRVTRRRDFDEIVHPTRQPPMVRIEDAVLDVAQSGAEHHAVAVLSDACRSRLTTAARLRAAARRRTRLRHRAFLVAVLNDAADGTHSILEWRYQHRVERVHGLPRSTCQQATASRSRAGYRDVAYGGLGVVVELDGRLGHDLALDRWADLDRDLASAEAGLVTLRLGYGQVLAPCRCAALIAGVLRARGWSASPKACGPDCHVAG